MTPEEILSRYENAKAHLDLIIADKETKRKEIVAAIQQDLDALEEEYEPTLEAAHLEADNWQTQVTAAIINLGKSIKGEWLHAVYSKPRVTWDSKGLEGYAVAHPEIAAFRKEGEPSVSIRVAK